MDVEIIDFPETIVAALEHHGSPARVNDSVAEFRAWRKASGLSPVATSRSIGVAYDNPATTSPEAFRFDICGSVAGQVPANPQGVINKVIPGGRCAVARHRGAYDRLAETVHHLFREWLPDSGETLREYPVFFEYLNPDAQVADHERVTDVYLPLA